MSILSDFKRILFGAKAVVKNAVDQPEEKPEVLDEKKSVDTKEDLVAESERILESLKEEFKDQPETKKESFSEGAKEVWDKTKEKAQDIASDIKESELYRKTTETAEKVGDAILDTGEKFYGKTREFMDGPGKEMAEKAKEISEDVGEKLMSAGKTVLDKARDLLDEAGEKLEKTMKKADEMAASEKLETKSEWAEKPVDLSRSTLEGKDDFFAKAARYADGDFTKDVEIIPPKPETTQKVERVDLPGMEDKDKDGDALIDDAEVVEDKPKS